MLPHLVAGAPGSRRSLRRLEAVQTADSGGAPYSSVIPVVAKSDGRSGDYSSGASVIGCGARSLAGHRSGRDPAERAGTAQGKSSVTQQGLANGVEGEERGVLPATGGVAEKPARRQVSPGGAGQHRNDRQRRPAGRNTQHQRDAGRVRVLMEFPTEAFRNQIRLQRS